LEIWKLITGALPAIWKYRRWGLLTTLVVGLIGTAFSVLKAGEYEASARAYVDTQSILKPLMQGMTVQPNVEQKVQMVARTLVSRPNLEKVAVAAGLDANVPPGGNLEPVLDQLEKKIILKPAGGTNFYSISYRHPSQEATLKAVEALLAIFMQSTQTNQTRDTRQALAFVDEQIALSKKKLEDTENALKDFKIANIAVMPNLAQDYVARSAEAQREQQQAKLELRQATNARAALQRRLTGVAETFASGESTDPLVPGAMSETEQRLQTARTRLDDFLTRYTDAHPDVINTRRVVKELEAQLDREKAAFKASGGRGISAKLVPNRLHQELSVSLADAEARVASLSARAAEAEIRIAQNRELSKTIPKVEAEFIQLNRDYASNKVNYEQLMTRRASAQMAESMGVESAAKEFRIVDPPRVSPKAVTPNRPLLLLATCFGSIAAGIAVAYLLNLKSPAFFEKSVLEKAAELPVLGSVSFVHSDQSRARHRRSIVGYSAGLALYSTAFFAGVGYYTFEHRLKDQMSNTPSALSSQVQPQVVVQ
jgi:polysaccharide chain length determinant protein (PEP-CTERM system associated)